MNSQSPTVSFSTFSGNENKALLWSVLHGGGKFAGIPDTQVHVIKDMFEHTIHEISERIRKTNQLINLNAINKEAVVVICKKIEAVKRSRAQESQQQQQQQPQQVYQKKQQQVPQLETIYKAEDLQKERQSAFQNELKKKEQEMSSILKLKKPEEINFTDEIYDKPIGSDMERLLAEALASRERELEQIKNVTFTDTVSPPQVQLLQQQSGGVDGDGDGIEKEKRVSFGNELQLHIIENNENNENNENDLSFIFNKLKRVKRKENDEYEEQHENSNSHIIIKMSQDIECIKTTLAELTDKLNKLCSSNYDKILSSESSVCINNN